MTIDSTRLVCYEHKTSKGTTVFVTLVGLAFAFYFNPITSWTFYAWAAMCLLFFILQWTHKPSKEPKLTIDYYTIKTTYGQVYTIKSIERAELTTVGKWTRHKEIYLKLYFRDKRAPEQFPVGNLSQEPKVILNKLLMFLSKQANGDRG